MEDFAIDGWSGSGSWSRFQIWAALQWHAAAAVFSERTVDPSKCGIWCSKPHTASACCDVMFCDSFTSCCSPAPTWGSQPLSHCVIRTRLLIKALHCKIKPVNLMLSCAHMGNAWIVCHATWISAKCCLVLLRIVLWQKHSSSHCSWAKGGYTTDSSRILGIHGSCFSRDGLVYQTIKRALVLTQHLGQFESLGLGFF